MPEKSETAAPDENQIMQLIEAARDARLRAYAPYSDYKVGAAVLGENGHVYGGCNIENASYSLSLCAERVALSATTAAGAKPTAIAVVTTNSATPCGACRQFMVELNPDLLVIIADVSSANYTKTTVGKLLPDSFGINKRT